MNLRDYIGERGETVFAMLITKWCDGKPWFTRVFLGEKAEAKDFLVNLIDPASGDASFFVQVKATTRGYSGRGRARKLRVSVGREDVAKLKRVPAPAFVVGIDVVNETGYLLAVTRSTRGPVSGIPVTHRLNCRTLKALWREVDAYWTNRKMLPTASKLTG